MLLENAIITAAESETQALGKKFAAQLEAGNVVALYGTLGVGKTHFTKGICSFFDVAPAEVNSPTFTLVNEYAGSMGPIYHFDAYRIEQITEFFEMGYEDYFFGDGICIVEWPDRIEPLLPADSIRLQFTHLGDDKREIVRLS